MASEANITQPRPDVSNGRESMARRLRGLRADVVPNEPNLRCRQRQGPTPEESLRPTGSCQTKPICLPGGWRPRPPPCQTNPISAFLAWKREWRSKTKPIRPGPGGPGKAETQNKRKKRMAQTRRKRKTKPIGPAPRAAETTGRAGAPNEPNFCVLRLEIGVAVKEGSQFPPSWPGNGRGGGNETNLRCRQGRDRRREPFLQPTASGLQPLPVSNEPNFTEAEEKCHAKVFTHKCLRVHWGIVGVMIESRMERNQARRLELGGPYHENVQGFVGIDGRGRCRRLCDGRGQ